MLLGTGQGAIAFRVDLAQNAARAFPAAPAPGADPELERDFVERPGARAGAFLELSLGYAVADANVQVSSGTRTIID
jgi:hypothetical protein